MTMSEPTETVKPAEAASPAPELEHSLASPPRPVPSPPQRRALPRTWETPPAPVPPPHLDDYRSIVGMAEIDELRFLARELKGKTLKMVNSTAVGGGVAEMLNRLVPLLNEVEVLTHWDVITGGNDFFEVTKAFHNALHGSAYDLTAHAEEIFLMYNEQNRRRMQILRGSCGDPRSPACSSHSCPSGYGSPLGVALSHRSLQSRPRCVGLAEAFY